MPPPSAAAVFALNVQFVIGPAESTPQSAPPASAWFPENVQFVSGSVLEAAWIAPPVPVAMLFSNVQADTKPLHEANRIAPPDQVPQQGRFTDRSQARSYVGHHRDTLQFAGGAKSGSLFAPISGWRR